MKKLNRPIKVANIIEEGRVGGPQKRIALVASKISKEIPLKNAKKAEISIIDKIIISNMAIIFLHQ